MYRDKNPTNMTKFSDQLGSVDWSVVESFNDPKIAYTTFHTKFKEIYNCCFPLKKSKIKRGEIHKPPAWLSKVLLKSIKRENVLYRQYVSNPTYNRECFYKSYRNRLNHSLRLAKRLYYNETLDKSKSNLKRTWKILNEVINRKKIIKTTFNV
jgi:hypothetical protein